MLLAAARELAQAGELPVNVRFCCDGEEETGGHSIVDFLEADERGADAAIIFDSGMIRRDVPAFNVATRGHGVLPRHAAHRRARPALGHVRRRRAERRARAGQDARRADRARRHARRAAAQGHRGADRRGARAAGASCRPAPTSSPSRARAPKDTSAAEEFYLRTFAEPALDVNGIASGSPQLQKTVLPGRGGRERLDPARARASRSRRSRPRSSASCAKPRPTGAELDVELWSSAAPGLVPPDAQAVQLGLDAFERALGTPAGADPVGRDAADRARARGQGHPDVITGFGLPDSQIHSPNERLVAEYVPLGHRHRARALPRVRGARSFLNAATADRRPAVAGRSGGEARRLLS